MIPFDNAMRRQVFSLPELLHHQYEDIEPKARKVLSTPEIFSIQRIVLTGCGDSCAAALAAQPAFESLCGLPTEVVPAINLARLYPRGRLGFAPGNPLVIAISNSGEVARVAEAVRRTVEMGAFTLALTGNAQSPVGKACSRVLQLDVPPFESAPGVRSYMVYILALLLLAVRFGEVRGAYTMDEAMAVRMDMLAQADTLTALLPQIDAEVLMDAEKWQALEAFDFVGSGFDYAAGLYGQAKIWEALGGRAMLADSESFLHLNFFMKQPEKIGTVLVANTTNPCHSRNKELLGYLLRLGRPLMVLTDGSEADFGTPARFIPIPKTRYPINMPLTQFAPLALLAGYLAQMRGEEYGRGCKTPWDFAEGGRAVRESEAIY